VAWNTDHTVHCILDLRGYCVIYSSKCKKITPDRNGKWIKSLIQNYFPGLIFILIKQSSHIIH
jgi:hypothetical protein